MRVIVTRPDHSARRTAARLETLGHQPVFLPLTRAEHHLEIAREALSEPHSALVVTSAEAVRVLSELGQELRPHLSTPIYAVGEATGEAARALGFTDIRCGDGTGHDLVERIAKDASGEKFNLLYLAGNPRSPDLEDGLRARGIACTTIEIYRMVEVIHQTEIIEPLLTRPAADAVLLYSRHNAALFFELIQPFAASIEHLQVICLSKNVASAVPEKFHDHISIAQTPDEDALFAFLSP
jgi:uroporphyrinogen-III synthase